MFEINIQKLSSLSELRQEIAIFSNVAIDAIQTLKQHINEQYSEMQNIVQSLKQKKEIAKQDYEVARNDYESCKMDTWEDEDGHTHYPDCSYEKQSVNDAYSKHQALISCHDRAKEIVYKAEDWVKRFNKKCDSFQHLAGNTSQNTIRYLDDLCNLAMQYIALANEYESSGYNMLNHTSERTASKEYKSTQYSTLLSEIIGSDTELSSNVESAPELVDYFGNEFYVKTIQTKNANGKEFLTWNITNKDKPDESFLSLKMNKETKKAILGDVKTKEAFWNISNESSSISLMEKTAKNEGCNSIGSWVSKEQVSFFKKNGYAIISENNSGAEIFKNL